MNDNDLGITQNWPDSWKKTIDEKGYPVCNSCGEGECSRFMDHEPDDISEDQKCHICLMDEPPCGFCRSMI